MYNNLAIILIHIVLVKASIVVIEPLGELKKVPSQVVLTERLTYDYCHAGLPLVDRTIELHCCESLTKSFEAYWIEGGFYLSWYLERLKTWKCPQMQQMCQSRPYSFNKFTDILHDIYCNETKWQDVCFQQLQNFQSFNENGTFEEIIKSYDNSKLPNELLANPCIHAVEYLSQGSGYGNFHETIQLYIPYCKVAWCGFSRKTLEDRHISSWECIPTSCKLNLYVVFSVLGILAILITILNFAVFIVFATMPKLQNSQTIYKLSLAAADFFTGSIVFPNFVYTLNHIIKGRHILPEPVTIASFVKEEINQSMYASTTGFYGRDGIHFHGSYGKMNSGFSTEYIRFCGIVSTIALAVSIYTLILAAFDRFLVVFRPLKYNKHQMKKLALRLVIILWLLSLFGAILPMIIPKWFYGIIASVLVTASGPFAVIIMSVAFFFPLLVLWIVTIATYVMVKRQNKERNIMMGENRHRDLDAAKERRLTITLTLMVGAFTLNVLPAVIVLVVFLFVKSIYISNMETFNVDVFTLYNSLEFTILVIVMSNSLWNCFIYSTRNEDFRKAAKNLFFGKIVEMKKRRRFSSSSTNRRKSRFSTSSSSGTHRFSSSTFTILTARIRSSSTSFFQRSVSRKTNNPPKKDLGCTVSNTSKDSVCKNNNVFDFVPSDNQKNLPAINEQ